MVNSRGGSGPENSKNRYFLFYLTIQPFKNTCLNGFLEFEKFEEL